MGRFSATFINPHDLLCDPALCCRWVTRLQPSSASTLRCSCFPRRSCGCLMAPWASEKELTLHSLMVLQHRHLMDFGKHHSWGTLTLESHLQIICPFLQAPWSSAVWWWTQSRTWATPSPAASRKFSSAPEQMATFPSTTPPTRSTAAWRMLPLCCTDSRSWYDAMDPQEKEKKPFECSVEERKLRSYLVSVCVCVCVVQDKAQPETQAQAFGDVHFKATLAQDTPGALPLVRQPGSDGFTLSSSPLFQVCVVPEIQYIHVEH